MRTGRDWYAQHRAPETPSPRRALIATLRGIESAWANEPEGALVLAYIDSRRN